MGARGFASPPARFYTGIDTVRNGIVVAASVAAMIGPGEAVRLLVGLAAGSAVAEDGEEAVDAADLTAALTLMPMVRAEIDQLEASLLMIARGQGMTWQELAFGLGLGSAQAARQRYERLNLRATPVRNSG
jgi:hypothetical protein